MNFQNRNRNEVASRNSNCEAVSPLRLRGCCHPIILSVDSLLMTKGKINPKLLEDPEFASVILPGFSEISKELSSMGEKVWGTVCITNPDFSSVEDVQNARDKVADEMISLMERWKEI